MAKRASKKAILILIVVALLAGGGGFYWYYLTHKAAAPATATTSETNKSDQTLATMKQTAAKETDAAKKIELYNQLSTAAVSAGKYQEAADAATQVATLDPAADNYGIAAANYALAGDKAKAIEYYKKALALTPKVGTPEDNTPYNYYANQILGLGGTVQ